MKPIERGAVNSTAPTSWRNRRHKSRAFKNRRTYRAEIDIVAESEDFTKDLKKQFGMLKNSPNARILDVEQAKQNYFRSSDITFSLHDLTYDGNENFIHYRIIADAVKYSQRYTPEVKTLWFGITIVGGREKWVITEILNQLLTNTSNNAQL